MGARGEDLIKSSGKGEGAAHPPPGKGTISQSLVLVPDAGQATELFPAIPQVEGSRHQ